MSTDLQRSLAMFRFNFWAKPFFHPPPPGSGGGTGLENSPFMHGPLTSPALMMLASTAAEGQDAAASQRLGVPSASPLPAHHHHHQLHPSFPGRAAMDKDLPPQTPPFTAGAAFMPYRDTPFSAPLPMPPYPPGLTFALPRPELDRRLALLNSGMRTGAFRPLGDAGEGPVPPVSFHSAFSPASASLSSPSTSKKHKSDDVGVFQPPPSSSASSTSSSTDHHHHHQHGVSHDRGSPSSACRDDPNSDADRRDLSPRDVVKEERPSSLCSSQGGYDTVSEGGQVISDSGDAFERGTGTPDSEGRSLRKQRKRISHDSSSSCCPVCGLTLRAGELGAHLMLEIDKLDRISRGGRKSRDTTPLGRKSLTSPCGSRKGKDSPPPEVASRARYDTFMRIRCNRQSRLSARRGQKKRRPDEDGMRETPCPVCNERISGTTEDLNAHVEQCLKQQRGGADEEEPVDVEGEFEEYEWAGQTRVRATSLLEGGFSGSGFQTHKKGSDDDTELNVDGDDTEEYGKPQFSERELVPLGAANGDSPGSSGVSRATYANESSFASRTDTVNSDGAGCSSSTSNYEACDLSNCDDETQPSSALVSALKLKLKDLEAEKAEKQKCLICMEPYKMPLTSIQCWHVHCENCWMRTLGAKKLCPQCNMITSPSDLRRIYL